MDAICNAAGEGRRASYIPIFVISLARSQRRALCRQQLDVCNLPFTFFDAIDGSALQEKDAAATGYDAQRNRRLFKRGLSMAEIACYLSHKAIWQRIAASRSAAVVLEDDFQLCPAFRTQIAALAKYDLSDMVIKLDSVASKRRLQTDEVAIDAGLVLREHFVVAARTTGYMIGPRAAARMLAARESFFRPVDIDLKFVWEHGVPILAAEPPSVREHPAAQNGSSISASRAANKPCGLLDRFFRNISYQAKFKYNLLRQVGSRTSVRAVFQVRNDND